MNLNQLRFVQATAETGSFSKAAEICFVTQPTLSNGISNLEGTLGEKLFIRTTRIVNLSKFGEEMLPRIEAILNAESQLIKSASHYLNPEKTVLKIGLSPLINSEIIMLLVDSFKKKNTSFDILLIENNLSDLYKLLDSEELDLIFVPKVSSNEKNKSCFIYSENLVCIDTLYSNIKAENVTYDEIKKKTFLMVPDSCGLSNITRDLFPKLNEYQGKALSYQVLENWATNGLGIAILPESKLSNMKSNPKRIIENEMELKITFVAEWKENQFLTLFLKHIDEHIKEIREGIFF